MAERLIGVDVGGTKVSVAALEGTTLTEPRIDPTEKSSADALVNQIATMIEAAGPASAIGIGIPSVVDFATGTARSSVNVPLENVPLRHILTERLRTPVFVDNDATVAALGEAYDEQLRPVADSLVMFTVGTGVGGGIVLGGRVHRGATGAAGELGHMIIAMESQESHGVPVAGDFPQRGSLEHLAAGRELDRLGAERGLGDGPAVVVAAQAGDEQALDAIALLGHRLGIGIGNAINTFDPEQVVIGGGVSRAGDLLLEPARQTALQYVLPGVGTKTTIRLARYGPGAGVRGAALLAGQERA